MGFAERLKELRTKHSLSQTQLADALDIPRGTVAQYESSNIKQMPRRERLEQIANYFNVTVDYLLGRTDDPTGQTIIIHPDPVVDEQGNQVTAFRPSLSKSLSKFFRPGYMSTGANQNNHKKNRGPKPPSN